MPIISWDQSYSVGVAELDNHHKKLISMINELYYAMNNDRGQQAVHAIIADMRDYARMHFAVEEGYMQQCHYLGILPHLKEHEAFTRKTQEMALRCEEGEFVLSLEVIQFLSDWLKKHILETDKKYSLAMKRDGIN